jgi:hypothetical protein
MYRDLLVELGIIMNLNDHTVTRDTDTIPMQMNHTRSEINILKLPKF